jgi:hypothetical protein
VCQAARAKYATGKDVETTDHLTPAKPDFSKPILSEDILMAREQSKIQVIRAFKAQREKDEASRQLQQELHASTSSEHVLTFAKHRAAAQQGMAKADRLRLAYKARLHVERERQRQEQQQSIAAEQETISNNASKDK